MSGGFDLSGMSGSPQFTGGAGGSASSGLTNKSGYDFGGWTVATGGSKATGGGALSPWLIGGIAVAALLGVWMLKQK